MLQLAPAANAIQAHLGRFGILAPREFIMSEDYALYRKPPRAIRAAGPVCRLRHVAEAGLAVPNRATGSK